VILKWSRKQVREEREEKTKKKWRERKRNWEEKSERERKGESAPIVPADQS